VIPNIYETGRNDVPTYPNTAAGVEEHILRRTISQFAVAKNADPKEIDVAWLISSEEIPRLNCRVCILPFRSMSLLNDIGARLAVVRRRETRERLIAGG
jgi:hypothetical protein